MPLAPRIQRATPRGELVRYPDADTDPQPCLVVLRWQGAPPLVEVVPAYRVGEDRLPGEEPNAVLVRWGYAPQGPKSAVYREDWFDPRDVLDEQPDPEDVEGWRRVMERPLLG